MKEKSNIRENKNSRAWKKSKNNDKKNKKKQEPNGSASLDVGAQAEPGFTCRPCSELLHTAPYIQISMFGY